MDSGCSWCSEMAANTGIEWTDHNVQPMTTRVQSTGNEAVQTDLRDGDAVRKRYPNLLSNNDKKE